MALSYWWPGPKMKNHLIFWRKLSMWGDPQPTFPLILITATYDNRVGFIFMPGSRLQWSILQCWLFCIHTRNRSKLTECGFHGSLESSMEWNPPRNEIQSFHPNLKHLIKSLQINLQIQCFCNKNPNSIFQMIPNKSHTEAQSRWFWRTKRMFLC